MPQGWSCLEEGGPARPAPAPPAPTSISHWLQTAWGRGGWARRESHFLGKGAAEDGHTGSVEDLGEVQIT